LPGLVPLATGTCSGSPGQERESPQPMSQYRDSSQKMIAVICARLLGLLLSSMLMFNVYTNVNNLRSYIIVKIAYFYILFDGHFSQYS